MSRLTIVDISDKLLWQESSSQKEYGGFVCPYSKGECLTFFMEVGNMLRLCMSSAGVAQR